MKVPPYFPEFDKAKRAVVINGLRPLDYGFARDIVRLLEATKCKSCHGNGFAPYVGGDDDEDPCDFCGGTGFTPERRGAA